MKYCHACGVEIPKSSSFCSSCGVAQHAQAKEEVPPITKKQQRIKQKEEVPPITKKQFIGGFVVLFIAALFINNIGRIGADTIGKGYLVCDSENILIMSLSRSEQYSGYKRIYLDNGKCWITKSNLPASVIERRGTESEVKIWKGAVSTKGWVSTGSIRTKK